MRRLPPVSHTVIEGTQHVLTHLSLAACSFFGAQVMPVGPIYGDVMSAEVRCCHRKG